MVRKLWMNQSIRGLGLCAALFALGCSDNGGGGGTGGTSSSTGGTSSATGGTSATGGSSSATGGSGGSTGGGATATCQLGMDTAAASTSAENACCLLCVKEEPCDPGTTLDMCAGPTGYRKCHEYATVAPACASASKAYLDCLRSAADVCAGPGPECDDASLAATAACN